MKDKKKLVFLIIIILIIIVWLIGMFIASKTGNDILLVISSFLIGITILGYMIFMFGHLSYVFIGRIIKTKKWYLVAISIIFLGAIISFVSGIVIFFLGTPFEGMYEITQVDVIDVRDNKILVDYSKYYNGDGGIIEINKPIYAFVKEGDIISVRYPINNPEKIYYVIDSNIGEKLLGVGIMGIVLLPFIYIFGFIIKCLFKHK